MISIKFWQNINQQLSKLYTFINSENILETLLKNVLLCEILTALAKFPNYLLSFIRYSTMKSSWFMFCQNSIETLYVPVVIYISW